MIKDYFCRKEPESYKTIVLFTGSFDSSWFKYFDALWIQLKYKKFKKSEFMKDIGRILTLEPECIITMDNDFYTSLVKNTKKSGLYYTDFGKYNGITVIQSINPQRDYLYWDKMKLDLSINTYSRYLSGSKEITPYEFGFKQSSRLKGGEYVVIDVETIGLRAESAILKTISFTEPNGNTVSMKADKEMILKILNKYDKYIFHNALFDIKILITNLFMDSNEDFEGMFEGLQYFKGKEIEDTMLLLYDKYNNTQGNELGLKLNVLKWTGNYALDVKDITKLNIKDLLEYNAIDTWATNKLYQEFSDYEKSNAYWFNIKSIPYLIELMIVGLPVNRYRLDEVTGELNQEKNRVISNLTNNKYVVELINQLKREELEKRNIKLKTKQLVIDDINIEFKPGSGKQIQKLLYEIIGLPVIEYTISKQPSTSGDTLKALLNHTNEPEVISLLNNLKDFYDVNKILTGFISPFYEYIFYRPSTKCWWLTGNHKLGGTISNRLASNSPNLAQLPSNSKYGKLIKSIFVAPNNWLFTGSDFSSLEDCIIANLSRDTNKVNIFTKGIDAHSINAYGYFKEEFDKRGLVYDVNDPESINKIKKEAKDLRQNSKSYTFAISYGQEAPGMAKKQGIPIEKAISIVNGYKELYKELVKWNEENKKFMQKNGYVKCCWNHGVKTPLIHMSLINRSITPSSVIAEFRSANNAITQSYGMLTTIAGLRFQEKLFNSKYRYDVLMINQIHDAIYLLIRNEPEVIKWVNKTLIETMCIMDEPRLIDAPVKLKSELDIGISWDKQETIPNEKD